MYFKKVHFIVNPISGKGKGVEVVKKIEEFFSSFLIEIKITKKKQDAYQFTLDSIKEKVDLIVSCGGDGTLNEVASALIGTEVPLAVVPIGSGNGLARHLNIPLNYEKALHFILNSYGSIKKIDCGKINDSYFFSNAGIGFDAEAVKVYSSQKQRQLIGYLKCILLSLFKFKPINISLKTKEFSYKGKIMLLNISNSNCMGYGFSIAPKASLEDGFFDVNLVPKVSWVHFAWIGLGFMFNRRLSHKNLFFNAQELNIETSILYSQIDGEYHQLETSNLNISMIPQAISILVG